MVDKHVFFTRISAAAFQLQQWTGLLQGLLDVRQVVLHLLVNQKSKHATAYGMSSFCFACLGGEPAETIGVADPNLDIILGHLTLETLLKS